MDKLEMISLLGENAVSDTKIFCSNCHIQKSIGTNPCDAMNSVEAFFEEGWRATAKNCYCPKCAKRKLKS